MFLSLNAIQENDTYCAHVLDAKDRVGVTSFCLQGRELVRAEDCRLANEADAAVRQGYIVTGG